MIYIDDGRWPHGRMKMSHMVADTHDELVDAAAKMGLLYEWIQYPGTAREHYDISQSKRKWAIENLGAKPITGRELVAIIRGKEAA